MYTVKVFLSVNREMLQDSGLCISLQEEELNNNNIDCILEEQNVSSTVLSVPSYYSVLLYGLHWRHGGEK